MHGMRRGMAVVVAAVAIVTLTTTVVRGQNAASAPSAERKVISRIAPNYPELAKKMHIHGAVRVEAVVRPNGSVKSTRLLGGNPVLVDAAVEAVNKWKFESAQGETAEVVQLVFEAQ